MNKRRLVGCCVYCARAFETQCGYGFYIGHFDRNEISFLVIKYHVNTTRNKMHQNIRSFWNAAKMKLEHVNRTCFHAGLKSQTGMSSFRLSCERTLRESLLLGLLVHFSQFCWSYEDSAKNSTLHYFRRINPRGKFIFLFISFIYYFFIFDKITDKTMHIIKVSGKNANQCRLSTIK